MRILLVEDDVDLRNSLIEGLGWDGFNVAGVGSALEFYREMAADPHDIAIVDIGLPDQNGLEIVSWLHKNGNTGVILLTGQGKVEDRVKGFKSGADLYFVKPVDHDELTEAIRNLSRRIVRSKVSRQDATETQSWYFDPAKWTLRAPDGQQVKLAAMEMLFMERLLMDPGKPVSRHDLQVSLGYGRGAASTCNLDALVKRLRRKLEDQLQTLPPIQTVHGHGYVFSASARIERRSSMANGSTLAAHN